MLILISCDASHNKNRLSYLDFEKLSNEADSNLHCLILSPAGSDIVYHYEKENNLILPYDTILYLPYPVHEGFILRTLSSDAQPLRAIILGKQMEKGHIYQIVPIALLNRKSQKRDEKWIFAVPVKPELKVVKAIKLYDLLIGDPSILVQLENWFINYRPDEKGVQVQWTSEGDALDLIKKNWYH